MTNKKVELLSPAGSFEGLLGAINAGADAIYLGGTRFSARALAVNFYNESLVHAINLAHLFKRRIYLTLNTLLKEKEFSELYDYLCPFYEAGLDGIIIQDFGVLKWLKQYFPELKIHASTQMNVTHAYGARFLKKYGVSRIIPARELSLKELAVMRKEADIELETFIHGAMCYSYSGRCLFSSMLGGRSGNRGRCAQPCRLPYETSCAFHPYPLSLKDMCTIDILPDLIEAGISSFKIEGRMKKPEYTAGVTAIYRKYIDLYYAKGREGYQVSAEDRKILESLYIRSEISVGYYFMKNSTAMITPEKPSYDGCNEVLIKEIREKYIETKLTKSVNGLINLIPFENAKLELECDGLKVIVVSGKVAEAKTQPILTESVNKQLRKTGESNFIFSDLAIEIQGNVFVPIKELNELRRNGLKLLKEELLKPYHREAPRLKVMGEDKDMILGTKNLNKVPLVKNQLHCLILTKDQWMSISRLNAARTYIDIDLWQSWFSGGDFSITKNGEWYAVLPPVIRISDPAIWDIYEKLIFHSECDGVLIGNIESYEWLKRINYRKPIIIDSSLYIWNREAMSFWQDKTINGFYLAPELNWHEIKEILPEHNNIGLSVYGRVPMMYTANCIRKTKGNCCSPMPVKDGHYFSFITDRYNKQFPVYHNCHQCYNIIYNSVPLSLHDLIKSRKLPEIKTYRLDFTNEKGDEVKRIYDYFYGLIANQQENKCGQSTVNAVAEHLAELPYKVYTTGHIKRGVT